MLSHAMDNPLLAMSLNRHVWITLALLAGLLWLTQRFGRLAPAHGSSGVSWLSRLRRLPRDTQATATLEFALVTPILLFLILLLTQSTLLVTGQYYVHYAAFAAARTAIVEVPRAYNTGDPFTSEGFNEVVNLPGAAKYERIRRSARFAVIPAAGRLSESTGPTATYVDGIAHHFASYGIDPPGWVYNVAAQQMNYAFEYTHIDIMVTRVVNDNPLINPPHWRTQTLTVQLDVQDQIDRGELPMGTPLDRWRFAPHAPITIRVEHDMALTVPYIGALFADGMHPASTASGMGRFTRVVAMHTLTNQGAIDALPPAPPVPREP